MSLQADLRQRLIDLNTLAEARVHHEIIPQGVPLPFIASSEVFGDQPMTLDGQLLLASSQVRLAIFAKEAVDIFAIIEQIEIAFRTFRGLLGETKVSTVRVSRSTDEPSFIDGDLTIKGKALDLLFKYYN